MSEHAQTLTNSILSGLLEATQRLRKGLLRADANEIQEAVIEQSANLELLEREISQIDDIEERRSIRDAALEIQAVNRMNFSLTLAGMRTLRGQIRKFIPEAGYTSEGGTALPDETTSSISTSI